jgi:hypothetical protein
VRACTHIDSVFVEKSTLKSERERRNMVMESACVCARDKGYQLSGVNGMVGWQGSSRERSTSRKNGEGE